MIHPDRVNNIPSQHESISNQSIEEVEQAATKKVHQITENIKDLDQQPITKHTSEGRSTRKNSIKNSTKNPKKRNRIEEKL